MLSAAALDADLLLRELTAPTGRSTGLESVARELREGLVRVNDHVAAIREHAYGELEVLRGPTPVSLAAIAQRVVFELRALFPSTSISVADPLPTAAILAPGGDAALSRVLHNLVCNACEGDGRRAAARVSVHAALADAGRAVEIAIEDDGPGFPADVIGSPLEKRRTSKPEGSGLGLLIVAGLLGGQASTLRRENRPGGGARVSFELPVADAHAAEEEGR
jgi:signal transduction histidine kinase